MHHLIAEFLADGCQQFLIGGEVVVERTLRDLGGRHDLRNDASADPFLRKHDDGAFEQSFTHADAAFGGNAPSIPLAMLARFSKAITI